MFFVLFKLVPHTGPLSSLLFVIYVSVLHMLIAHGIMFSYIDDFTVNVS